MLSINYIPHNILVTGGAGFIGANFVHYYLKNFPDVKIVNLDLLTYAGSLDNLEHLPAGSIHHFVKGDICNKELIMKILREHQIDTIVHFAAESHVDRSIKGPAPFIQTNIVGTFTLLESAKQYWLEEKKWDFLKCRFHHVSTDEVYGSLKENDPAFTELTAYSPNSPYSASKASSDHLVRAYFHTYQLPMTMSHCSNNYGPLQNKEKFIPTVIESCLNGAAIPVYGNGTNIRDWLYVEDHCAAILSILHQGKVGESYNIGGEAEMSNITLVKKICEQMEKQYPQNFSYSSLIAFVEDRPGHDWRYAMDISNINSELNWKPKETFETGLRKTIEYFFYKRTHVFPG